MRCHGYLTAVVRRTLPCIRLFKHSALPKVSATLHRSCGSLLGHGLLLIGETDYSCGANVDKSRKLEPHTPFRLPSLINILYRCGMNTTMNDDLATQRQAMVERCTEEAKQLGRTLLFGMTTALTLQSVPLPDDCDLDASVLHTVASAKERRVRAHAGTLSSHIWQPVAQARKVRINRHVLALDVFHTWAQLASHISFKSLVILGDAVLTAASRQTVASWKPDRASAYGDLVQVVEHLPKFSGRKSCIRALMLMQPGSDSPKESELRLMLQAHGIPRMTLNYTVPNMAFASGAPVTVDFAWPEHKVAIEYDGDHHRTDKAQWRRDQDKRSKLLGRGWLVFVATASNLADADARAEFAFRVGRALTSRGAQVDFQLTALPLEQLAPLPRVIDWQSLRSA